MAPAEIFIFSNKLVPKRIEKGCKAKLSAAKLYELDMPKTSINLTFLVAFAAVSFLSLTFISNKLSMPKDIFPLDASLKTIPPVNRETRTVFLFESICKS